jgi:hypothetical protein
VGGERWHSGEIVFAITFYLDVSGLSTPGKRDNTKVHAPQPEIDPFSLLDVAGAYDLVFAGFVIERCDSRYA